MCGICGSISQTNEDELRSEVNRMLPHMLRRGPDFGDVLVAAPVALGHRRLSIIDLSEAANQPMQSANGQLAIVFNGEIYNFRELRRELEAVGMPFSTQTDTEVILHGYAHWGLEALLNRLEGMFAFALTDFSRGETVLVRDQLGKKPLYVYSAATELLFASDLRAIHAVRKTQLTVDFEAIDHYFTELCMPQPHTIWREVKQVQAGHFLRCNHTTLAVENRRYWKHELPADYLDLPEDALLERTETLLRAAIDRRSYADVPMGCFLSGGIDSGLVTAFMAQQSDQRIDTFSVGMAHETMNELPDAAIVAKRYNTKHHEIIVDADVVNALPDLLSAVGEPFADSSLLPSHYVCKAIRGEVTVALSGDGGDELFGGYSEYNRAYRAWRFGVDFPAGMRRDAAVFLDKLQSRLGKRRENLGSYADFLKWSPEQMMHRDMGWLSTDNLYHPDFNDARSGFGTRYLADRFAEYDGAPLIDQIMAASLNTRLLNDYLVKLDRASMYNSLEVRSPFLDGELLAFAFSIHPDAKFKTGTKHILKTLAQRHIDTNIHLRPKRGFGIPLHEWLRGDLKLWAHDRIFGGKLAQTGWFNRSEITRIWDEHMTERANHVHKLWALICLAVWLDGLEEC